MALFESLEGAWVAVQVRANRERTVASDLERHGYAPFLPTYRFRQSPHASGLRRALFPGYLFCAYTLANPYRILQSPGVVRIVGIGREPMAVPTSEVEAIMRITACESTVECWRSWDVGQRRCGSCPVRQRPGRHAGDGAQRHQARGRSHDPPARRGRGDQSRGHRSLQHTGVAAVHAVCASHGRCPAVPTGTSMNGVCHTTSRTAITAIGFVTTPRWRVQAGAGRSTLGQCERGGPSPRARHRGRRAARLAPHRAPRRREPVAPAGAASRLRMRARVPGIRLRARSCGVGPGRCGPLRAAGRRWVGRAARRRGKCVAPAQRR